MPIFSSQLVKVEDMSPEKGIKTIANHLRKLQEELEYRLMNLDSSNINEINASETEIRIEDGDGNFSEIIHVLEEISLRVVEYEGDFAELKVKADAITEQVGDADGNLGKLEVRADAITEQVRDADGNLTTLKTTAEGIEKRIEDANGNFVTLKETALGIEKRISDADGNFTTLKETAQGIEKRIEDANGDFVTLKESAQGIEKRIEDANGNFVTLKETAQGIEKRISDANGNFATLKETAEGIEKRYDSANGNYATLKETADGIDRQYVSVNGNYATLKETADGIDRQYVSANGNYTTLKETADGVDRQYVSANGNFATLKETADGIEKRIEAANGNYATLKEKSDGIIALVGDGQGNVGSLETRASAILAQVGDGKGNVGSLETRVGEINQQVSDAEGNVGALTTRVNNITLAVTDKNGTVALQVKSGDEELGTQGGIELTGMVTFNKLGSEPGTDDTVINGGWVDTDTLTVKAANVTGLLSSAQLRLYGDMAVYESAPGEGQTWEQVGVGGHIGWYATPFEGIGVYQKNDNGDICGMLVCNEQYARLSHHLGGSGILVWDDYIRYEAASHMIFEVNDMSIMDLDYDDDDDVYSLHTYSNRVTGREQADLGTSTFPWGTVYADTDTIETSDRNRKNTIEDLPDKYVAMFDRLVPRRFKLNNGKSGRFHVGYIAQEVEEAMTAVGVESQEFGGFVKSKAKDEDGEYIYMLRYGEFGAIYAAKIKQLEARLARVEEGIA